MIDLIKKYFGATPRREGGNRNGPRHDICIAACALLLEMSRIDGEMSDGERDYIVSVLRGEYGIPGEDAEAIVRAADEELAGSRDLWQFTSLINRHYSPEEKLRIIEIIWNIAYRDGKLDAHEDYLVHKLAMLLGLNHRTLIDAKLRMREAIGISGEKR